MVTVLVVVIIIIYFMSKMWEVFAQSPEPEAHVKNSRQQINRIEELIPKMRY